MSKKPAPSRWNHSGKEKRERPRVSEKRLAHAFLMSPLAMTITSARDHRYLEVNEFFEKATGYARDEVLGKTPFDIDLWANPEQRRALVETLLDTGSVRDIELQVRTKGGELRNGLASADLIEIGGEPCVLSVAQDITEQKRVERALRDSEERLRIAIQSGQMYAFDWDIKSDVVQRSEESSKVLGAWLAGDSQSSKVAFIAHIHPEDRKHYCNVVAGLAPEHPKYRVLFRFQRTAQKFGWLEESGRAFFNSDGKLRRIVGITADVTEARETERALRELSGRLISSQEEERRRVARELHDNIGQDLALLAAQSQRVDSGTSQQEGTLQSDAHEIHKRVKDIALKVSQLSHRLHSSELDFLGLGVAVERLCRDFDRQYGIDVDFDAKNLPQNLDGPVALCFYRVTQEALQNVAKHSQAKLVRVRLTCDKGELKLGIQDDGVGFDVEKARFESGLGLISMQERMHGIGGLYRIHSKVGTGTKLQAVVAIASVATV
jgi:PAS domain S-box-containing protein